MCILQAIGLAASEPMTVPMALVGLPTLLCDEEMMSFDNSVQPESL